MQWNQMAHLLSLSQHPSILSVPIYVKHNEISLIALFHEDGCVLMMDSQDKPQWDFIPHSLHRHSDFIIYVNNQFEHISKLL